MANIVDFKPQARIAAHRFGLGEASLAAIGMEPLAWLDAQIGPADPQRALAGAPLARLGDGLRAHAQFIAQRQRAAAEVAMKGTDGDNRPIEQQFGEHFRAIVQADLRAHLATAAASARPFAERLALFWANHFTVSNAKASTRGLVGAFEREAIRPHIGGRFETLLGAAVRHGAMLTYLDNNQSAGPHSRVVQTLRRRAERNPDNERGPRVTGLNENLAREVLELHTLGAASKAYSQADVTAMAAVLTGWRVASRPAEVLAADPATLVSRFDPAWHEPGDKTLLGQRYREGEAALATVLHDLARHPATARFIALKLARHFIADDPDAATVDRLAATFTRTEGDLPSVYRELLRAPAAWAPQPAKLKTPAEIAISSARLLGLGEKIFERTADAGLAVMGQRIHSAPSPAGWPDRAEEWLGPDAVWKRIEWTTRLADRAGRHIDARALARNAFADGLSEATAQQLDRAADGPQALALLLLAPEFQRR